MGCRICGCPTSRRLCRQCEIEERAEERARATARDQDDDDDEGEDPVPLPDGGPVTDAELDAWVGVIEAHADDTTVADHLGGIHEHTLREEFDIERSAQTIRDHFQDDDRVVAVLGFGQEGVRRSWAPAGSDIGVGEDVACPRGGRSGDTGQPCVVCGHAYDRDARDECPQCTNGSVEDYDAVTDGGVERPVSQAELERRATAAGTSFLAWCGRADVDADDLLAEIRENFPSDGDAVPDGSGHVCKACGESFETLTRLRLHEKDDCQARETFGEIDPDVGDPGMQAAGELATCRECGRENANADFSYTTSFDGDDFHYIVEFACRHCGFDNENRVVMTGVYREDLQNLPPHLQPDDLVTDGGRVVHPGDAARGPAGIGDQTDPTCPNGDVECAKPGTAPCAECFFKRGGDDV